MSNYMTRAEAICACNNIVDLAEEMSERLPDNYYTRTHEFASGLRKNVRAKPQYPNVTENMDGALRRSWAGLKKWDRDGEHNDELFFGLTDVVEELLSAEREAEEAKAAAPPLKGREASPEVGITPEQQRRLTAAAKATMAPPPPAKEKTPVDDSMPDWMKTEAEKKKAAAQARSSSERNGAAAFRLEDLLCAKENAVSIVLSRAHGKNLRVVAVEELKLGNIERIMSKTKSDRTHQLIWAAYYAGQITGATLVTDEVRKKLE